MNACSWAQGNSSSKRSRSEPGPIGSTLRSVSRFAESRALAEEVADLNERLESRKVVDRAKGLIMERGVSEPEAFKRLQKLAMDKRMTLRDVAQAVILAEEANR